MIGPFTGVSTRLKLNVMDGGAVAVGQARNADAVRTDGQILPSSAAVLTVTSRFRVVVLDGRVRGARAPLTWMAPPDQRRSSMRSIKRLLLIPLAVALMASLATSPASAITNGQPDNGRHPYVGLLVFDTVVDGVQAPAWRCTGSLLSPTVVLTAGHCTDGAVAARLWTDENVQDNAEYPFSGSTSYDGTPYVNPDFCIGCGSGLPGFARRDVGVVVLSEPVPTSDVSDYASLPSAGHVSELPRNAPVDLVGYGVQKRMRGHGQPVWTGLRVRLFANARLVSGHFTHSAEFIRVTANPGGGGGGTCFGDSGGPVLDNNGDTVLGVNSYVTNLNCSGVTYSQRVDVPEVLDWVESFLS
jgi:secreted trypsin-like serine protease